MRIDPPPRRTAPEPLLPMIDVVFFLVVFFMMVGRLAAPEPFAVTAPEARGDPVLGEFALYVDAAGEAGFAGDDGVARGPAAMTALAAARAAWCGQADCAAEAPPLLLHADAAAPATRVAALLPELAAMGFANLTLITAAP